MLCAGAKRGWLVFRGFCGGFGFEASGHFLTMHCSGGLSGTRFLKKGGLP